MCVVELTSVGNSASCCFGDMYGSSLGIHIILHLPVEFHPNRTILQHSDDVISTATASQFYFRFRFSWLCSYGKVEIYLYTKFRYDISIHSWYNYYFRFLKQTSAMLEFYLRFRFLRCVTICMSFCIRLPNFIQIGPSATELWRHIYFSRWCHGIAILLPVSVFVTCLSRKVEI